MHQHMNQLMHQQMNHLVFNSKKTRQNKKNCAGIEHLTLG
jgi:hypothetical protein